MRVRKRRGGSLIETVSAAILLIPIALAILDVIVIVVANSMNDTAVKNAARAAANQEDFAHALDAAKVALESARSSSIVKSISILTLDYPNDKSAVSCKTSMVVRLPVPFPGLDNITFVAQDVEPILVK